MNIHIIQPAIPKYRKAFFEKLSSLYSVKLYSTKQDFLGVKTVLESNKVNLSKGFISFSNKCYWHKSLPLILPFKKDDIVVINGNPRIINYMLLFIVLRLRGIKTVWWGHGWSAGSVGLMSKIRIKLMKIASAILVYTDKEQIMLSKLNCFALNNGLDSTEIRECITKIGVRREYESSYFNLVFVGRITEKANFELLLKSMSMVNSNVYLNVIGSGDNDTYYKKMAEELGIGRRIYWHGAIFNERDIAEIMLSSHAFIYPGSVGLSLIHAFNYGLPAIIHSDESHHMPEAAAFKNHHNGLYFRLGDIYDLKDKINEMSSISTINYQVMSSNAFNTVLSSYNVDDMVSRFNNMIKEIIK